MSAVDALKRGRFAAEALMIDTCTIDRPGTATTDPETGAVTNTSTRIYPTAAQIAAGNPGKCKVQSKDSATSTPEAGESVFIVVSRQVHIPAGVADVRNNDVITITASVLNPFGVGRKYRVEGFTPDSFDTAARIPVKEIT